MVLVIPQQTSFKLNGSPTANVKCVVRLANQSTHQKLHHLLMMSHQSFGINAIPSVINFKALTVKAQIIQLLVYIYIYINMQTNVFSSINGRRDFIFSVKASQRGQNQKATNIVTKKREKWYLQILEHWQDPLRCITGTEQQNMERQLRATT